MTDDMPPCRQCSRFALPVALALAFSAGPVQAGDDAPRPPQEDTPASAEAERPDPCRGDARQDEERLDQLRRGVSTGVCASTRWFDGLFGDARDYSESYQETYGRFGAGLGWNKVDGVGLDGHFRATVHLPSMGNRFNAVIGRETEETFVTDNFDEVGYLPGSFSDDRDAEWYAGLSYNALEGTNTRFDFGAGIQLKSPLNPYVKARYRVFTRPTDNLLVTTRPTAFWENIDGFGVTLPIDMDWAIAEGLMLRWANTLTRSEATDGVRWKSRLAFYDALSERSALRYEASIRGETAGIQPYHTELKVTYRRSAWRDWFFIETFGGIFWADNEKPEKRCDGCGMVGVGFEMMFGDRYDRPSRSDESGSR
jgi:hypothetical protein